MRKAILVGAAAIAVLVTLALAELALVVLVFAFSAVLDIKVVLVIGSRVAQFIPSMAPRPAVVVSGYTIVLSLLLFLLFGVASGARTFQTWRRTP